MSFSYTSTYYDPTAVHIPKTLSEIWDLLGSMWLSAPTFVDSIGHFPDRNIDSEFTELIAGFGAVRNKLGEERHTRLIDLAARAKALFAADPQDDNGQADAGRVLLSEIEDVIREVRNRRVATKLPDDEGEVSGD